MELFTYPLTCNAIKVSLILAELQIEPELTLITLNKGEQKRAEFLSLNPNGTIPVLKDQYKVLWESNAILFYLAKAYNSPLSAKNFLEEVEVMRWLSWQASEWSAASSGFAHHRVMRPFWGLASNEERLAALDNSFKKYAAILDQQLSWQDFLISDDISIADISVASTLMFWREAEIPIEDYSNLHEWLQRLENQSWWLDTKENLNNFLI
ncbi:glutathione S-transferase family protein [Neptuniibacter sp. PT8_73]|uniref:glutathione S-transferase family protein n=1 Tax=Neptuniibacter sp. PT8_73 TaxID=3398206 RepID=UPI0039F53CFE